MSHRVLVADDEPLARARLLRFLAGMEGFAAVGEAANGAEALERTLEHAADIVLMDIRMPVMDGLQAASRLAQWSTPPAVILCTAYSEHALAAFDARVAAYLLKPVREQALSVALQQVVTPNRAQLMPPADGLSSSLNGHLAARSQGSFDLIPLPDICCLLADQKYVTVFHVGGEQLIDRSLRDLERDYAGLLVRVHRNALVASGRIRALERGEAGQYRMRLQGTTVRPLVSRRHLPRIRELLAAR